MASLITHICADPREPRKPPCKRGMKITKRRKEILYWLARGKQSKEVGQILGITWMAVKSHIRDILTIYRAPNRMSAVMIAIAVGDVSLDELLKDFERG